MNRYLIQSGKEKPFRIESHSTSFCFAIFAERVRGVLLLNCKESVWMIVIWMSFEQTATREE